MNRLNARGGHFVFHTEDEENKDLKNDIRVLMPEVGILFFIRSRSECENCIGTES